MNPIRVAVACMAAVTFYVGFYHLYLFYKRKSVYSIDLSFSLLCFSMGLYDLITFMAYGVSDLTSGFLWQRLQVAALSLSGVTYFQFMKDFTGRGSVWMQRILFFYFILSSFLVTKFTHPLFWRPDRPAIKEVHLAGLRMRYVEVSTGPYTEVLGLVAAFVFLYFFWIAWRLHQNGLQEKSRPIFWATTFFFAGVINDASVLYGFYRFFYLTEFAYLAIVLLMAYALSRDLLEGILVKKALIASEQRYRQLVDRSLVGIFLIREGRLNFCNQRFAEIFGYPDPAELIGKTPADFLSEDQANLIRQSLLQTRTTPRPIEVRAMKKEGEVIDLEVLATLIENEEGQAVQGSVMDVTERKRARQVLEEQARILKQNHEDLQQFAYLTSHELREPLRSIAGFVELLAQRYSDRLDDRAREYIGFVVQGVNRMDRILKDFLAYVHLGQTCKKEEGVDLNRVLERALLLFSERWNSGQAEIQFTTLPSLACDPDRIQTVFEHLIDNALKFNQNRPQIQIAASFSEEEKAWIFSVADNGIGIPQESIPRIFGLFKRLYPYGTYPGSGIGLAICKKIIEQHGGHIWVESAEGKGSTFFFTLPAEKIEMESGSRTG